MNEYERWCLNATLDPDLIPELTAMDAAAQEDAFYRELAFGTGGLRGVIGAGTNRMNVYTVGRASQGLAGWLKSRKAGETPSVVIGHDSRIKSDVFALAAARVFAANGIRVHLWPRLLPVPTVSYAVRKLGADAGVMITASHNPSKYNGYKVYGADGCQITTEAAEEILSAINAVDVFSGVSRIAETENSPLIGTVPESVLDAFVEEVKAQSVLFGEEISRNAGIVYTPLNGSGLEPVTRVLRELGYTNVTVVEEQRLPDGRFPTCPFPNPEIPEALALGMEYARRLKADLLLATDPDCDRVGIAVRTGDEYRLFTGNEVGLLLLDYICAQRVKHGKMPADPVLVKTIVSTDLADRIAESYGLTTINVLTGFKFIGEQIGLLEKQGRSERYVFGFEESYGCLSGTYVRDKDGVNGAALICEMYCYYAARGITLAGKLAELYAKHGYCLNTLHSYTFEGASGFARMNTIMADFRSGVESIGGLKVEKVLDYSPGLDGLPASDVLKYLLEGGTGVVVRPSGTEPKLKVYLSVNAPDAASAGKLEKALTEDLARYFR